MRSDKRARVRRTQIGTPGMPGSVGRLVANCGDVRCGSFQVGLLVVEDRLQLQHEDVLAEFMLSNR
jgi:hypothetical protein